MNFNEFLGYGVYMVDTKGLAYWLKELAAY